MLKFLFRCVLFCLGLALAVDAGLPMRTHWLHVDRHTSSTQANTRSSDTSYTLHLVGGNLSSCDVGYATYSALKDGDGVVVQSSKLFKRCISIAREGEILESSKYWRWVELLGGLLLMATAIGWLKSNDDDDDSRSYGIRVGW